MSGVFYLRAGWAARLLGLLVLLGTPALTFAQSCALCYTQAAVASSRFIQALRSGILVLIIPPLAISLAITILAYRKRNQFNEDADYLTEAGSDSDSHSAS